MLFKGPDVLYFHQRYNKNIRSSVTFSSLTLIVPPQRAAVRLPETVTFSSTLAMFLNHNVLLYESSLQQVHACKLCPVNSTNENRPCREAWHC